MFELKETINGVTETVVDGMSYSDFNEKRIWVNTINRNTTEEIEITYQLRIWIKDDVVISDTEDYANYTTDKFQNGYASVKVNVKGDFEYKEVIMPAACFAYRDATYYALNTSSEAVETCKDYFLNTVYYGYDQSDAQDGYQSYCEGIGTVYNYQLITDFYNDVTWNNIDDEERTFLIENDIFLKHIQG